MANPNCDHGLSDERHSLRWPENLPENHPKKEKPGPRNIWNPFAPACLKCKKSIGEILKENKKRIDGLESLVQNLLGALEDEGCDVEYAKAAFNKGK